MSKICIVADSSTNINLQQAKQLGIEIAPLSIIVNDKEYQDQVDMAPSRLIELLKEKAVPTTSQPNLGLLDGMMKNLKSQNFDYIIVFTLSSFLSGTHQAFRLAATDNDIENIDIVDSLSIAGPLKDVVLKAAEMAKAGATKEEILAMSKTVFAMTTSFLFPNTLDQLKRGGRVSPAVAALSSLLKIKPLLMLKNGGTTIEKFNTARTETKIFDLMLDEFEKQEVKAGTHKIHVLHCEGLDVAESFITNLKTRFGDIEVEVSELPAVLAAHAGIKSIAVQASLVL
jgi:DegV family protein with EDD domain